MDKIKRFLAYFSEEIKVSIYCLLFFIFYIPCAEIFDKYNISTLDRSLIILFVSFSMTSFSGMYSIFKHIFKK